MAKTDRENIRTRSSLLARLKDWEDKTGWQQFDNTYRQLIRNFALKQGLNATDADDVVQDTLLAVAKAIRTFDYDPKQSTFKNWLLTVTRHRIADHFRKSRAEPEIKSSAGDDTSRTFTVESLPDPKTQALEADWDEEWKRTLLALALDRLKSQVNPKHYQVFHLLVLKGQPACSVAKALGVSRPLVYLVKHRLLPLFKKTLAAVEKDLG